MLREDEAAMKALKTVWKTIPNAREVSWDTVMTTLKPALMAAHTWITENPVGKYI
jgi:hypothetical protein